MISIGSIIERFIDRLQVPMGYNPKFEVRRKRFRNIAGPVVRRLRNSKGWSQLEFAAKLQIAGLTLERADIAKIEAQLRSLYDFELFTFASVLGVEVSALNPGQRKIKPLLPALKDGFKDVHV